MRTRITILVLIMMLFVAPAYASWDTEYWQQIRFRNWSEGQCMFYTTAAVRFSQQLNKVYYFRATENFAYRACRNLDLEAHFTYIYEQPRGVSWAEQVLRSELEINPSYVSPNRVEVVWRNRFEFIKKQSSAHMKYTYRHRMMVTYPLFFHGRLQSISCYDEVFMDLQKGGITQNRCVPLQLNFYIDGCSSLDVFFMIRNYKSFDKWYRSFVLGSQLNF